MSLTPPAAGTLSKFYMDAMLRANSKKERYGTAIYNHLWEVRPDLAEIARGSLFDPYDMKGPADNFRRWDAFAVFVETRWYLAPGESPPNPDTKEVLKGMFG